MKLDRILITGATGFIGRHLVSWLLACHETRLTLAVRDRETCPSSWRSDDRLDIIEVGPIELSSNLDAALKNVSTVCHLAGLAHAPRSAASDQFFASNAVATERLVRAAANTDVRTFIHLSSLAATTKNASPTMVDDSTDDPAPTSYGASKKAAEQPVLSLANMGKFAISLRPPLVVGADAGGNWAALQRLAATGVPLPFASIRNKRSFVSIETLVAAIDRLCSRQWPAEKSGNYCIADEDDLSLPEVVAALRRGMGLPPRLFPFPLEVMAILGKMLNQEQAISGLLGSLTVDSSQFHRVFDFRPPKSLMTSIEASGRHYRREVTAFNKGSGLPL